MPYLLDTNACIALINGRPPAVRKRFRRAAVRRVALAVSSVSLFELWYGVAKSAKPEVNQERLEGFLSGPLEVWPFDDEAARAAGRVRAVLEVSGKPIGAYDVLLAGQALAAGATLVTATVSEFARVPGLAWEDWASARQRGPSEGRRRKPGQVDG